MAKIFLVLLVLFNSLVFAQFKIEHQLISPSGSFKAFISNTTSAVQQGPVLRYYINEDNQSTETVPVIDWSPIPNIGFQRKVDSFGNIYLELNLSQYSFTGGASHSIDIRIHTEDWSPINMSDDYSLSSITNRKEEVLSIPMFLNGTLVFGNLPNEVDYSSTSLSSSTDISSSTVMFLDTHLVAQSRLIALHPNSMSFELAIKNEGTAPISNLELEYYLDWSDHEGHIVANIDWSEVPGLVVELMESPDYLATIKFKYPESFVLQPGESKKLHLRWVLDNNKNFDTSNDHSAKYITGTLQDNPHIGVYAAEKLLFGMRPSYPIIPNQTQSINVQASKISEIPNQMIVKLLLTNNGTIPVQDVAVIYSSENHENLEAHIDYSSVTGISSNIVNFPNAKNVVIELGNKLIAVGETVEVHLRLYRTDYSTISFQSDFSYSSIGGSSNRTLAVTISGRRTNGLISFNIDTDEDGIPDEIEIALGTNPTSSSSRPIDESGANNIAQVSDAYINTTEQSVITYDLSHIEGYSHRDEIPIRLNSNQLKSDLAPIIQVFEGDNLPEPPISKNSIKFGRVLEIKGEVEEPIQFAFPIPNQLSTEIHQDRIQLRHWNDDLSIWEVIPVDTVMNGAAYANVESFSPFIIELLREEKPISNGDKFQIVSLKLNGESKLYGIGKNDKGQLGIGTTTADLKYLHPVLKPVEMGEPIYISSGKAHTILLDEHNQIWCWGDNSKSQCSDEFESVISTPQRIYIQNVEGNSPYTVSAGAEFSHVVYLYGDVFGWGNNLHGQVGVGSTNNIIHKPLLVQNTGFDSGNQIQFMASGFNHAIAVGQNGLESASIFAWGDNHLGQLGLSPTVSSGESIPTEISFSNWTGSTLNQNYTINRYLTSLSARGDNSLLGIKYTGNGFQGVAPVIIGDHSIPYFDLPQSFLTFQDYTTLPTSEMELGRYNSGRGQTKFSMGQNYFFNMGVEYNPDPGYVSKAGGDNSLGQINSTSDQVILDESPDFRPSWSTNFVPGAGWLKFPDSENTYIEAGTSQSMGVYKSEVYIWGEGYPEMTQGDQIPNVEDIIESSIESMSYLNNELVIEGKTNPNLEVTLIINNAEEYKVIADAEGDWSLTEQISLPTGSNKVYYGVSMSDPDVGPVIRYQESYLFVDDPNIVEFSFVPAPDDQYVLGRVDIPSSGILTIDLYRWNKRGGVIKDNIVLEKSITLSYQGSFSEDLQIQDLDIPTSGYYFFELKFAPHSNTCLNCEFIIPEAYEMISVTEVTRYSAPIEKIGSIKHTLISPNSFVWWSFYEAGNLLKFSSIPSNLISSGEYTVELNTLFNTKKSPIFSRSSPILYYFHELYPSDAAALDYLFIPSENHKPFQAVEVIEDEISLSRRESLKINIQGINSSKACIVYLEINQQVVDLGTFDDFSANHEIRFPTYTNSIQTPDVVGEGFFIIECLEGASNTFPVQINIKISE